VVTRRFPVFQQTLQQWRECDTIGYCEVNLADVLIARRRKLCICAVHARSQKTGHCAARGAILNNGAASRRRFGLDAPATAVQPLAVC
jgi:hypothetical protein